MMSEDASLILMPIAERIQRLLPKSDDLSLVVLKGHLLIEEQLDQIIEAQLPAPKALSKTQLGFAMKTRLAQATSFNESNSEVWELVMAYNTLRNDLVHNLDSDNLISKSQKLINLFLKNMSEIQSPERFRMMGMAEQIWHSGIYIVGALANFAYEARREKNTMVNPASSKGNGVADEFFKSRSHRYIFALTDLDGAARQEVLGLTPRHYRNPDLAKHWYHAIAKVVHPDVSNHPLATSALSKLTKVYQDLI